MDEVYKKIRAWAGERNFFTESSAKAQFVKLIEEWKEIPNDPKDGVGDSLIVLIILAAYFGIELETHVPRVTDKSDMELLGNLANALNKSLDPLTAIRELYARLHTIPVQHGLGMYACLVHSFAIISNRQGKMIAGTWVKESDIPV
ncbi:hypothetical protein R7P75_04565 [Vibrio sp. 2175-1]|uniref:hypothetical protein n=1 Tax=Vibrio TaxID=662 RepID=UPI001CDBF24C|nr:MULTISPECIES: hypothetical protein [Vibrio]MCA2497791.1 hypothetical protein [Vibrio alginolyticus]MDW2217478.1 hypothetical protein [Vibrio sp. 2175-1]